MLNVQGKQMLEVQQVSRFPVTRYQATLHVWDSAPIPLHEESERILKGPGAPARGYVPAETVTLSGTSPLSEMWFAMDGNVREQRDARAAELQQERDGYQQRMSALKDQALDC
jgi:hypothetical protein